MRHPQSRVPDFNSFKTSSGDKFHVNYSSSFRPDGTIKLNESGRVDIQAEINSHAAETDMSVIINKLRFGDTSVLSSKPPMYGDFTQFPKTYAEMLNLFNSSQDVFKNLSAEVRSKYDNDINKWFSAIGTDSWLSDMGISKPVVDVPSVELDTVPSEPVFKE